MKPSRWIIQTRSWFLNLVAEAETELSAGCNFCAHTKAVENALGRVWTAPKGPRTIDIDILLYGDGVVQTAALEIPHPRMAERRFVLAPLADLAPDLRHPVTGKSIRELLAELKGQIVRRVESPIG